LAASQDIASWILPDYRALGKSGIISERQFNGASQTDESMPLIAALKTTRPA
jgi:hypothetical protein